MKIYDFPFSPNCRKVRAVAYELGLKPEFVNVNLFTGEQRLASVTTINPNAKVPILVDGDFVLWESNAIASYLAEGSALLPASGRERAEVQRWADWQLAQLGPAIRKVAFERLVKPMTGGGQPDPKVVEEGIAEYARWAGVLEASLGSKEYVAGRLSIADFIVASVFTVGATCGLETAPHPKVNAWLGRVLARDSMRRTLAEAQASIPRGQAMVALAS
ncbi:MAG: glutathione S-transferase family protein [Polyangiaceae bacterium]